MINYLIYKYNLIRIFTQRYTISDMIFYVNNKKDFIMKSVFKILKVIHPYLK